MTASVFLVVQTDDDQDEAWWIVASEATRGDAMEAADEVVELLKEAGFSPDRLEDSKGRG